MSFFDDFLKKVPAEDQAILNKYPELKASTEKLETDNHQLSQFAGQWVNWQNQNWDPDAGMTKAEKALRDELSAAQARIAAGVGTSADDDTVKALEAKFEAKLAETHKQSMAAIEGMNLFYQSAAKRMLPHQREFNEDLDPNALMTFMQQNKIADPEVAYDKMVAGRRAELATQRQKDLETQHAADIAAAEQRGRELAAKEAAMGPSGVLPTDHTGGIAGVTARMDKPATISDELKTKAAEAKLGDGTLAALGYEAYRQGQFSVQ